MSKVKLRKISAKIMRAILLVNVVSLVVIGVVVGMTVNSRVGDQSKDGAETQIAESINAFELYFSDIESAVSVIVNDIRADVDVDKALRDKSYLQDYKKDIVKRLETLGENTDLTRSIYVYFNTVKFDQEVDVWMLRQDDGSYELQGAFGYDYYLDYNAWYSEPIDNKNTLWTFPYESSAGGLITSYVTPVIVDGEAIAMVGMDLYLDDVEKLLEETTLYDTGYLYLMHPDGRTIIHPRLPWEDRDGDGTPEPWNMLEVGDYQFLLDEMNSRDAGFVAYDRDDGSPVIAAFGHLNNGWIVASSIPANEVMAMVTVVLITIVVVLVVFVIVAILVSLWMGNSITRPIRRIVESIEHIKNGDFTTVVEVKSKDETKLLADGLNDMSASVRDLIVETKHVSRDMVDSASNLAAMSEETNATVDQVAVTIQEIAKGTQETAGDAETGAEIAANINNQFVTLMDNSTAMKENAEVAIEMNKTGLKALDTLKEKSSQANSSNERVKDAVDNLDKKANEITDIIQAITSIAEQTNLLALNASIEAARAGEAGRGFAVVADEIRKLAESSSEAAEEIRTIIVDIQGVSQETVSVMNEVTEMNEQQNEALGDVNVAFDKIFSSVDGISSQIEIVTTELDALNDSKNQLVASVNNISAISEETAAATEEVERSMDEQTKAVEQVAENADRLNALSSELNQKIEFFKV
ncbi:methyl-accepting chemotaxis protein [Acidaminobacter sp. JC074]|uniref:methyl-accepting chemotaxis protein n=1 Tax=Acidaminobacter sp. JC074 TaxID=2530199 RepID=UPI001F103D38|nr:methyl-accepting chemotaxis protein [Acidaminobacter sp. JC074]